MVGAGRLQRQDRGTRIPSRSVRSTRVRPGRVSHSLRRNVSRVASIPARELFSKSDIYPILPSFFGTILAHAWSMLRDMRLREMRVTSCMLFPSVFATALLFGGEKPRWEEAVVISQNLGSQPAGTYAAPLGGGAVAVPIYSNSNIVVIETGQPRYVLTEPNLGGPIIFRRSYSSSPLILPVNGKVQFYRDGDWFIFMDRKHKKHRFSLVGETVK